MSTLDTADKGTCFTRSVAHKFVYLLIIIIHDLTYDHQQCKIDLYDCMNAPDKGTMECLKEYMTCMEQLIPTLPPMPPSVVSQVNV